MRFWMRWAIVMLPVVISMILWIESYRNEEVLSRFAYHNLIQLRTHRGSFTLAFLRDDEFRFAGGKWFHERIATGKLDDHFTEERLLGFGYEHQQLLMGTETTVELPFWALTLLALSFPAWLYRRQRKLRKIGFPVETVAANSKESTPAQMD